MCWSACPKLWKNLGWMVGCRGVSGVTQICRNKKVCMGILFENCISWLVYLLNFYSSILQDDPEWKTGYSRKLVACRLTRLFYLILWISPSGIMLFINRGRVRKYIPHQNTQNQARTRFIARKPGRNLPLYIVFFWRC